MSSETPPKKPLRLFMDTEFIETDKSIDLLSIGIVTEDGREYYAEMAEADWGRASPWVQQNVLPHLGKVQPLRDEQIRADIMALIGDRRPIFVGYYPSYDWVAWCQLWGTMMQLPDGWPRYILCVKQYAVHLGNPPLPFNKTVQHHALNDARWTYEAWQHLDSLKRSIAA